MSSSTIKTFSLLLIITAFFTQTILSQQVRTSISNGQWSATSTWTGGVVPSNGDMIVINHAVILNISNTQVASLTIRSSQRLTVNTPGSITINGAASLNGSILGTGVVVCNGDINIGSESNSGIRLIGASTRLDISSVNVMNSGARYMEANVVRLYSPTGNSIRNVNGVIQTSKISELQIMSSMTLANVPSAAPAMSLGGKINLNGFTVTVMGGDVSLVGSEFGGSGSIVTTSSSASINVLPEGSTMTVNGVSGTITTLTATAFVNVLSGRSLDVSSFRKLIVNNLRLTGDVRGTNGTLEIGNLMIDQTGYLSLTGGASRVDIYGDIDNSFSRTLESEKIVLGATASRVLSGIVQTRTTGVLLLDSSQDLLPSSSSSNSPLIQLGGKLNGQGYTLSVSSVNANLTLSTSSVSNIQFLTGASIIVNPPSSTCSVIDNALVTFTTGTDQSAGEQWTYVLNGKRLDVSGGRQARFENLYLFGAIYGFNNGSIQVNGDLVVRDNGQVYMSGGQSLLVLRGNVRNDNNGYNSLQADVVRMDCDGSASTNRIVNGLLQSLKTGSLLIGCDMTLTPAIGLTDNGASAAIALGGVLNIDTNELTLGGEVDVLLVGNGINGQENGRIKTLQADLMISPSVTLYMLTGAVHIELANDAQLVVGANRRIAPSVNSVVYISPQLTLNGGSLDGAGRAIVKHVVVSQDGANVGEVRMDQSTGQLDVWGNIDNSLNGVFYASSIRLLNNFQRTIKGRVQTNSNLKLIIGCSTTLSSESSAVFGGRLFLNGQTLNIMNNDNLRLVTSYIYGPGYIRYESGCACDLPSIVIGGVSATYMYGNPIFQNLRLIVNNSIVVGSNSTLEVAGSRSELVLNARVSGTGNLHIVTAHIYAPSGRIYMSSSLSGGHIYYENQIVNQGTYSIIGTQHQVQPSTGYESESESLCADDSCLRSTLKDLRRQMNGIITALRNANVMGTCSTGLCQGWNSDYSAFVCVGGAGFDQQVQQSEEDMSTFNL